MDANESFELAAGYFYRATGMLMPGKDICAASGWTEEQEEERKKLFKVWCVAIEYMQKSESDERNTLRKRCGELEETLSEVRNQVVLQMKRVEKAKFDLAAAKEELARRDAVIEAARARQKLARQFHSRTGDTTLVAVHRADCALDKAPAALRDDAKGQGDK